MSTEAIIGIATFLTVNIWELLRFMQLQRDSKNPLFGQKKKKSLK